jgi:hypothetical protein
MTARTDRRPQQIGCAGCQRRGEPLTLFENDKSYCAVCAPQVRKELGIEPIGPLPEEPEVPVTTRTAAASKVDDEETAPVALPETTATRQREQAPAAAPEPAPIERHAPEKPVMRAQPRDEGASQLEALLSDERDRLIGRRSALRERIQMIEDEIDTLNRRLGHVASLLGEEAA